MSGFGIKVMKKLVFSIFLAVIFFSQIIFGCSLAGKSIDKFDETEYIFIGQVAGYTAPLKSSKLTSEAYGLIVKVKEIVYLPKTPETHFEIFPIQLWADCSEGGTTLEKLKKDFPVEAEIRVIAKKAAYFPASLPNGVIRLEDRPGETSSLSLNYDKTDSRLTSADSLFDYKAFDYRSGKDSIAKYFLPNFEVRKDLLRLTKAKNHQEVRALLDKLLFVMSSTDLSFGGLVKNYTLTEAEYDHYIETELKMNSPETYKEQYVPYKAALTELVKLGYERKAAEEALDKAFSEGTDFDKSKLVEKALQILRKK
jgi:hypothetical protein